jgi:SAM-dependent methyltransferase
LGDGVEFIRKILKALKNPKFAMATLRNRLIRKDYLWSESTADGVKRKEYSSYSEYVSQQKSKLYIREDFLRSKYEEKYRTQLFGRLKEQGVVKPGMNVLCLGARLGAEIKSFLDLGCFAIGLDLNPGLSNKYVVYGDFHDIQYPSKVVDVVFTNSLDHAFDLDLLIQEIKRVLKPNGLLILEIVRGDKEDRIPDYYESICWKTIDDLLDVFVK